MSIFSISRVNKILLAAVVALLIALSGILYWQKSGFEKPYYAVYLNTGDIYFGKISNFPKFSLSDAWYIQRNPQDAQNPMSLAKFEQSFWGPGDKLYLNEDSIIWKAKLREDSQVLNFIKNPQQAQAQQPAQGQLIQQEAAGGE